MKLRDTPTPHDYERLQQALRGGLVSILPFMLAVIALEFVSINGAGEGWFFLVYCLIVLAGLVWAWRSRFRPRNEVSSEQLIRASTHGPRLYLLFGIGSLLIGLGTIPLAHKIFNSASVCEILMGFSFIYWSFQFPRVTPDPEAAKRWQFSLPAVLITTSLFSLYLGAVIWLTKPEEHIVVRCIQPLGLLIGLGLVCYLIELLRFLIVLAMMPVRLAWWVLTKTFDRPSPHTGSGADSARQARQSAHHDPPRGP